MSLSAERFVGSNADDPEVIKTSHRPCLSKLHSLFRSYIFFALSIRGWFNLMYDLQSSPKLPFLCSVFSFQGDCLIWPLHRSLQGQRAKGRCRKDGGEKNHTVMWMAAQTGASTETIRAFSHWCGLLAWQKMKVVAVEVYINHRLLEDKQQSPGPCQCGIQGYHSRAPGLFCCISSPENGTIA